MTVHAFVDESERNRHYLLCAAIVQPEDLGALRKRLVRLLLPGQRELHFKREKCQRQRFLSDAIARFPVTTRLYRTPCCPRTTELARQRCLTRAVQDLLDLRGHRLVLDTRQHRDRHDIATIQRVLGAHPAQTRLTYEHVDSTFEPLCWIADAAAWCYGSAGDWRRRMSRIMTDVVDL